MSTRPSLLNLFKKEALHFIAGTGIGLSLLFFPRINILIILAVLAFIMVTLEILKFVSPAVSHWLATWIPFVVRKGEERKITGTTYFLLAAVFVLLVFPVIIAATAILFSALGDPSATVIGSLLGRIRLFGKTLEGDLACLAVCLVIGIVMAQVPHDLSFTAAVAGAFAATIIQAFTFPVNDNIIIPVFSALVMWGVSLF